MDTRNGVTRRVLSQVKLEQATRPQALAEEDALRSEGPE